MANYERRDSGVLVPNGKIIAEGVYHWRHVRDGAVIDEWDVENIVVNEGLTYILGAALAGQSQITSWYLGLFSANYTPVGTDTDATFVGSATEVTFVTNTSRPAWTPPSGAVSGQSITNAASQATFTFNAGGSVYGAFLSSGSAFGETSGKLLSAARFSAVKTVTTNDQLLMTYTLSAASS